MRKRDYLIVLAVLLGPFASSLWTYRYWDALRRHIAWVCDGLPEWDGIGLIAGALALVAHLGVAAYVAHRMERFQ